MAGISTKAAGGVSNKFKYNGKEEQRQEFADGSGLELMDYGARMYDGQVGRFFSLDPHGLNYENVTPYNYAFNNPIYFIDLNGMDGIAAIERKSGTKKDPHQVVVTANYYYKSATEGQKKVLEDIKGELGKAKTEKGADGQYYSVTLSVNFIQDDNPEERAAKDISVEKFSYGNVLSIEDANKEQENASEAGEANNEKISIFKNVVENMSLNYTSTNQTESYNNIFANALKEEILHNLGGNHADGGALPGSSNFTYGSTDLTKKEQPAEKTIYTSKNAISIYNRIGGGYGQNKNNKTNDPDGNVGKVEFGKRKL